MYRETLGRSRTAWSKSSVMSLGKLVMNLIRSMPAMSCNRREQVGQPAEPAVRLPILVAVDGLAQEGDFLDPLVGQQPGLGQDHRRAAGSARARAPRGRCSRCKTCRIPS